MLQFQIEGKRSSNMIYHRLFTTSQKAAVLTGEEEFLYPPYARSVGGVIFIKE